MSRQDYKDIAKGTGISIALGVAALVVVIVLGAMWIFGFGLFQRSTANFRGGTAANERIFADPDTRLSAYSHFFDLCSQVQSDESRIKNLEAELSGQPAPSEARVGQIQASITAVRNQRAENINRYNTDSAKDYTIAHFKDLDLPTRLSVEGDTQCTSFVG